MLCRLMCALLFLAWTTERAQDEMYALGWRSPFGLLSPLFESLPGVELMPWQLLLLAMGPIVLLAPGTFRRRAWPMDAAILVSLASVAATFAWGVARGGSAYQSYFQLRWFLASLFAALLLGSLLQTPDDLRALGRTILAAALVRGGLATYFYLVHVRGRNLDPIPQYMTTHDDSLLFTAGILLMVSWALARRRWMAWILFGLVFLYLAAAMRSNNRRLAWLELIVMGGIVYLLLPRRGLRRRVNRLALLAAPLLVVYVTVGWGRAGAVFAPVRAISTTFGEGEDVSSMARNEENLNLVWTFQKSPLLGLGWGHPYQEASSAYTRGFGPAFYQYPYLPHNSMVALATFSGLVGLLGIWLPLPVAAFLGSRAYWASLALAAPAGAGLRRLLVSRAAAMSAVAFLPAYGIQCFGDIGFQSLTGGLLLASAAAAAAKAAVWTGAWPAREPAALQVAAERRAA